MKQKLCFRRNADYFFSHVEYHCLAEGHGNNLTSRIEVHASTVNVFLPRCSEGKMRHVSALFVIK